MKVLVTGGAGFIGSNFVRHLMTQRPTWQVTVLDKLTYAGNLENLSDLRSEDRFEFVRGDICDAELMNEIAAGHDAIVNLAAETHVDRSIHDSSGFVRTDIEGTRILLEAARLNAVSRYLQVSTDEVYGDMAAGDRATEEYPLRPRSPYSASKAGADLMVQAYHITHGLDAVVTRCSNNYGPYQFPEKLIPLFVRNALSDSQLPLYGDGLQQRDWIYVEDHCRALMVALEQGHSGAVYNIGTGSEHRNVDVAREIVRLTGVDESCIVLVPDRRGHDRRYALDSGKMIALGWRAAVSFRDGLQSTVDWYRTHEAWWRPLCRAPFEEYYERQYGDRLRQAVSIGPAGPGASAGGGA